MTHAIRETLLKARVSALVRPSLLRPFFTSSLPDLNLLLLHYLFHLAFLHYFLCNLLSEVASWPLNNIILMTWTNDSSAVFPAYCIISILLTSRSYDWNYSKLVSDIMTQSSNFVFCWLSIVIHPTIRTNRMHHVLSIYINNSPLHVSSNFTAHHQEVLICIYSNRYTCM